MNIVQRQSVKCAQYAPVFSLKVHERLLEISKGSEDGCGGGVSKAFKTF